MNVVSASRRRSGRHRAAEHRSAGHDGRDNAFDSGAVGSRRRLDRVRSSTGVEHGVARLYRRRSAERHRDPGTVHQHDGRGRDGRGAHSNGHRLVVRVRLGCTVDPRRAPLAVPQKLANGRILTPRLGVVRTVQERGQIGTSLAFARHEGDIDRRRPGLDLMVHS